jgi:coniferyl-aldehyde dehydrogenase
MTAITQIGVPGRAVVEAAFEKLKTAQARKPNPSAAEREDRLDRLEAMLVKRKREFVRAVSDDFGHRSAHETMLADVALTIDSIREARRSVRHWMKPERAAPSRYFIPSSAFVEYLPKGVVGIIAPWNYPVNLALAPTAAALAAGNRVLIKPSELTPRTSALLDDAIRETFTAEEVAVVEGGPEIARAVTKLPLDHLLFTGSTEIGKIVGQAALSNLVPVTLELGGKSPALVHADYDIDTAAERIALGKLFNAGQTCIAPDYALVGESNVRAFADAFFRTVERAYLGIADYTSIVSERHQARLSALVEDARTKGARIETAAFPAMARARTMAPTLILDATDDMRVMQEEIFGPILPVKPYAALDEAIAYIGSKPRPLAFYYFDNLAKRRADVLARVVSGGACINDTLVHFAQERLPFGGVGASGMGAYHGRAGFLAFSHARGVLVASRWSTARRIQAPPYGRALDVALDFLTSRFGRWLG